MKFWTITIFFSFPSEFFMPGMVDTHIHAPQYSFTGTRVDLPLLQWLTTYTFPTEAKYKDSDFAEEVYTRVVVSTANVIYLFDDIHVCEIYVCFQVSRNSRACLNVMKTR